MATLSVANRSSLLAKSTFKNYAHRDLMFDVYPREIKVTRKNRSQQSENSVDDFIVEIELHPKKKEKKNEKSIRIRF